MQADSLTRILLALILISMLLLVGQGAGFMTSGGGSGGAAGRYEFSVAGTRRSGPLIVRMDTTTGIAWRKSLTGDGPWVIIDQETREVEEGEDAKPPAAPSEGATAAPGDPELPPITAEGLAALEHAKLRPLLRMIEDFDIPELQDRALATLAEQDPDDAVPILLQILDHPRPAIVVGAVRQLEKAGDPAAIPPLRKLRKHRAPEVRSAAAHAIETLSAAAGPEAAAPPQS